MKPLQNNFTTPEQSKRLLELGVPADSADCYYETFDSHDPNNFRLEVRQNPKELSNSLFNDYHRLIPCWSAGRLMEIYNICKPDGLVPDIRFGRYENMMHIIIDAYVYMQGRLDFSKLEYFEPEEIK